MIRYHPAVGLIKQNKAKVLSFAAYKTAAVFYACDSHLSALDCVQDKFFNDIGVSELVALTVFNLAPLRTRRGMAMLGVIHRAVIGQGPPHFANFFYRDDGHTPKRARFERHEYVKDCAHRGVQGWQDMYSSTTMFNHPLVKERYGTPAGA